MLESFENTLVELFASGDARARFRVDPEGFLERLDLAPKERRAILALSPDALARYGTSLVGKRWSEVSRVVPLTIRICPSLGNRYRRWALNHPAEAAYTVLSPGCAEALRALAHVKEELRHAPGEASYASDLFGYETLSACARSDGIVRTMTSVYALDDIVVDLRRGLLPIDPEIRPTHFVFESSRTLWNRP